MHDTGGADACMGAHEHRWGKGGEEGTGWGRCTGLGRRHEGGAGQGSTPATHEASEAMYECCTEVSEAVYECCTEVSEAVYG
jgi:hypothetical protein